MLWDQIDNSLLTRQNEMYRRRLAATRWVAAASLLLATLAGTGWWARRDTNLGNAGMATVGQAMPSGTGANAPVGATAASARGAGGIGQGNSRFESGAQSRFSGELAAAASASAVSGARNGNARSSAAADAAQYAGTTQAVAGIGGVRSTGFGQTSVRSGLENGLASRGNTGANFASPGSIGSAAKALSAAGTASRASAGKGISVANSNGRTKASTSERLASGSTNSESEEALLAYNRSGAAGTAAAGTAASGIAVTVAGSAEAGATALSTGGRAPALAAVPALADPLDGLASALVLNAAAALPLGLAAVPVAAKDEPAMPKRWSYGASYTAGLFSPNVNFSRAGIEPEHGYNPALGAGSPQLTEAAAAEYRQNLRPGLSQRLALLAVRHLPGHWSVSTGMEFTQATAQSATTAAFVGEQLPDIGQASAGPLRTTDFRYRLASVPVEMRYSNPVKKGWSLYGRLGGAVSALLGVRSEVEGYPEATRTYAITSAGTPYRRVMGSVRGAAGAQFRTSTGKWAFTVGPVAEIGLLSLNAHPAQGLASQSRPYSVGLEAGVEFGR